MSSRKGVMSVKEGHVILPKETCYLSASGWNPRSEEEALAGWIDGKQFKIRLGPPCTVRDYHRIMGSGWKVICIVYQREDLSVSAVAIDLSEWEPPKIMIGEPNG